MPFSFSDLRKLQLGGFKDTAALLGVAGGALATNPAIAANAYTMAASIGAASAAMGGAWLGRRLLDTMQFDVLEGGTLKINSSEPPPITADGVHLGYIVDSGKPLVIPLEAWMRHAMIVGQSGVGKTVLGNWVLAQQIGRGGGLVWIDGKLDPDNITMLRQACMWAGRPDDLLIINPGDPSNSHEYNPILSGDPDEVASRCISLIPATESDAGADHYRQSAMQALTTLFNAVQSCGLAYSFADMFVLLTNAQAMSWLEQRVPYGSDAQKQLSLFIHNYKRPAKNSSGGPELIDPAKLKDTLGGIAGRLFQFGTGKFGKVLNSYSPDVDLVRDLRANKIIYVALPTMGKNETATSFGKMCIGDLRTAISKIQDLPKGQRPWPPTQLFADEAGSYVTMSWSRMIEQARSAHISLLPAFQTRANMETLGEELRAMISGNTLTKAFFKPGEPDTADWMADMIGEEFATVYSITANRGVGASRSAHVSTRPGGWTDSDASAFSESTQLQHKITGTELQGLGQGEAIITFDGDKVYHVRVPMIRFDPSLALPGSDPINRHRRKRAKGLQLAENVDRWIGRGAES